MPISIPNLDALPNAAGAVAAATYVDAYVLAATTAEAVTVPIDAASSKKANYVRFSGSNVFYVNWQTTAAIPAADVTDGTSPVYFPATTSDVIYIGRVGDFSIIAPNNGTVITMEWFL